MPGKAREVQRQSVVVIIFTPYYPYWGKGKARGSLEPFKPEPNGVGLGTGVVAPLNYPRFHRGASRTAACAACSFRAVFSESSSGDYVSIQSHVESNELFNSRNDSVSRRLFVECLGLIFIDAAGGACVPIVSFPTCNSSVEPRRRQ